MQLNQSGTVYVPVAGNKDFAFPPSFHADPADYLKDSNGQPKRERLSGAQAGADPNEYFVYHKTNTDNGPAGRYLVNNDGVPVYLADPGHQRHLRQTPRRLERAEIHRAESDARLLHHQGNPRRPTAVGPGVARRFHRDRARAFRSFRARVRGRRLSADLHLRADLRRRHGALAGRQYTRRKHAGAQLTEDQLVAEGDKSNGVLLSSGYIAGGTLAGVLFAFLAIPMKDRLDAFEKWATAHNPFFEGPRRSPRDDSVRCALRSALSRRARSVGASKAEKIRKR